MNIEGFFFIGIALILTGVLIGFAMEGTVKSYLEYKIKKQELEFKMYEKLEANREKVDE